MTTDDTIRLDITIDDKKATRNANKFIDKLEADFKKAQKALADALSEGVGDAKASENVKKLTREVNKAERELKQFRRAVNQAGDSTESLGKKSANAGDGLKRVSLSLGNIGKLAKGAGLAALAAGFFELAQAAVEFGRQSLVAFEAFETGISEVRTLLPNLSEEAFGQLQEDVLDFSLEIGRTTEDILPALYQALSAGVPQDNVFQFLEVANQAAIAGVSDLETSVDALSSVVNAYGDDVITAAEASDVFFTTIRLGKTTFTELAPVISQVTPLAADLGVGFADIGAAIAEITATGTPTAQAITQIRSALVALADPASEISNQFEALTGQSFREFIAAGNDLGDAFAVVGQIADTTGIEFQTLFGRIEGSLAATVLAKDGAAEYSATLAELKDSTGATSEAAEQFSGTIAEAERRTAAQTEALKVQIGQALAPAKIAWLELKGAVAESLSEFVGSQKVIADVGDLLDELGIKGGLLGVKVTDIADSLDAAGISTGELSEKIKELEDDFEGTNEELLKTAIFLLENEKQLADVAQGVQVTTDRYTAYAESLGLVVSSSDEVATATDDVTGAFELSEEQAEQARQAYDALDADAKALADTLANDLARSAEIANDALNSALGAAGGRIDEIIEGRQATRGGGGGGRSRVDIERELQGDLEEIELERIESVGEAEKKRDEDINDLRQQLNKDLADERIKKEDEIADVRKKRLGEIGDIERELDAERLQRLREFNSERSEAFLDFADEIRAADEAEEEREPQTVQEQARDILGEAAAEGAELGTVSDLAQEAGVITAEQAAEALEDTLRDQGQEAIKNAIASGEFTGSLREAIEELNRQIAEGAEIDLSAFGVQLETAAAIEADIATRKAAERRRVEEELANDLAAINEESANRTKQIAIDAAKEAGKVQTEFAKESAKIQAEAAKDIAKANDRATQAIARGQKTGGRAVENTTEALAKQLANQLLVQAANETDLAQKRQLFQLALQELTNVGLLTQAEADRQLVIFELQSTAEALARNQEDVNTAFQDGESTLKNNQQTVDLLKSGYFETAGQAKAFASVLREDQIPAFIAALEKGVPLRDILADMGVKISELPDSVQLTIETNAPEALSELEKFEQKFKELDGQEVNTKVNVEVDERAAAGGGTGATGAGPQAPGDAFMQGGYTGNAPVNQVAGVVHGRELVVPDRVLKGGVDDVVRFALSEVPAYRNNSNAFPAPSQSFGASVALPSQVTNINNATSGDTITTNGGDTQTVNLFGNQAAMVARGVFEMEGRRRDASLMRRGDRITQL